MKNIVQTIALLLTAMVSFNTVNAQAVKFHAKEPPTITQQYLTDGAGNITFQINCSGTLYGCGDASSVTAFLEAQGSSVNLCRNGGADPGPIPGQTSFSIKSDAITFDATNGHASFNLSSVLRGTCKGNGSGWTSQVSNVTITKLTLWVNGVALDLTRYL